MNDRPNGNRTTTNGSATRRSRSGDRVSRFCFTLNNWTDDEYESIKSLPVRWLVVGKEVGDQGTRHLQGACVIGKQLSFAAVKQLPGLTRAHIEAMRGTPADSLKYCSKEDLTPFVIGDMPTPGKRNDIHTAVERIQAGESLKDLAKDTDGGVAIVKFHKGLNALISLLTPIRRDAPFVYWIHGKTGTGKTRCCVEYSEVQDRQYWMSNGSLQWFDGYVNEPVAILDDLRSCHAKFSFLLRLLDRYTFDVPIKGGFVRWQPEVILITSPYDPATMWSLRNDEDKHQLVRRCTKIWDMDDGQPDIQGWILESRAARLADRCTVV